MNLKFQDAVCRSITLAKITVSVQAVIGQKKSNQVSFLLFTH